MSPDSSCYLLPFSKVLSANEQILSPPPSQLPTYELLCAFKCFLLSCDNG